MITCRFCGTELKHTFLDLGETPLANSYLPLDIDLNQEPHYPLHVYVCHNCYLVQAQEVVPAENIFSHYAYFSSYSSSWVNHAKNFVNKMTQNLQLNVNSFVVEIASNDGYLLKHFVETNIPCLGIEPAENVAQVAINLGIPTEIKFFGLNTAKQVTQANKKADLIIANNVLAHVPDLNDFVAGLAELVNDNGVISIEFPHLLKLIEFVQFDTIYHEHYCYFSLFTLEQVFAKYGLTIFDVEELTTHGGSLRIFASKSIKTHSSTLLKVRQDELTAQFNSLAGYQGFAQKVNKVCEEFKAFLEQIKQNNKTIMAYGAAAKGNTFLNYCGIDYHDIPIVVDKNPAKQNHLLPASHIPIHDPIIIEELKPDYVLILPWNIADEIAEQMASIRNWGGQFVTAIPSIRIF